MEVRAIGVVVLPPVNPSGAVVAVFGAPVTHAKLKFPNTGVGFAAVDGASGHWLVAPPQPALEFDGAVTVSVIWFGKVLL